MNRPARTLLALGVLLAACSDTTSPPDFSSTSPDPLAVSVMARNAYIGVDVDAVIAALSTPDEADDFPALLDAIETLGLTDFPTRALALAAEIARTRPHVVGLAEISFIDIDLTPLGVGVDFTLDFLPILQAALAAQGLGYAVGAQVQNIDVSVAGGLVHLVDYDVVLYDAERVTWQTVVASNFENNIPPELLPPGLVLERGWIWGRATIGANTVNIVSTHLESGGDGDPTLPLSQLRAGRRSRSWRRSRACPPPSSWATSTTSPARHCTTCCSGPRSRTCGPRCVPGSLATPAATRTNCPTRQPTSRSGSTTSSPAGSTTPGATSGSRPWS
jgi:hypothetical protein